MRRRARALQELLERTRAQEGQRVLGWRDVPVRPEHTGATAGACRPEIRQLFVARAADGLDQDAFERKLYVIRRVCEQAVAASQDAGKGLVRHLELLAHASTTRAC